MKKLTPREDAVYTYILTRGNPTDKDIALNALNYNLDKAEAGIQTAQQILRNIEAKGYIKRLTRYKKGRLVRVIKITTKL